MTMKLMERARTAAGDRVYLTLPRLVDPLQKMLAAFAVVATNGDVISRQPSLLLKLLPTLSEDMALVREHVLEFADGNALSGGLMASYGAVSTIAKTIQNMCGALLPVAQRLDQKGPNDPSYAQDLASFRSVLTEMSARTTSQDPDSGSAALQVANTAIAIGDFLADQISDDLTRLETAKKEAEFEGDIASLEQQISSLQAQINGLNNDIAAGATSQIGSALLFGFQVGAKEIATALTDPGEIVLNVGFAIKDEVDKGNAFAAEMQAKNDQINGLVGQYRTLMQTLIEDEQEMAILLTVTGHCAQYRDNIVTFVNALEMVLGQIQLLRNGIANLALVDVTDSENFFSDQLNEAISGWKAIGGICEQDLTLARSLHSST